MSSPIYIGISCIFFFLPTHCQLIFDGGEDWYNQKNLHTGKDLYVKDLETLSSLSDIETFENILKPIMTRRVPGTPGHTAVREYIVRFLESLDWAVQTYPFSDNTPHGQKNFVNIVASYNPNALRKLVVACHYDSKFFSDSSTFIGATDSAVPCAMMLDMAVHITPLMLRNNSKSSDLTLELVFFDGEEAFKEWTHTDSIYGARYLAQKWSDTPSPVGSRDGTTYLDQIDVMILLDLIGTKSPRFYNFFESTQGWYAKLAQIENELRMRRLITAGKAYFQPRSMQSFIEDDHIPFLQRGVKILHLIPNPFPSVWHTDSDDWSALHFPTIDNLNKILRSFIVMYLRLNV